MLSGGSATIVISRRAVLSACMLSGGSATIVISHLEQQRVARVLERLESLGAARVQDVLRLQHERDVILIGSPGGARRDHEQLVRLLDLLEDLARRRVGILIGVVARRELVVRPAEDRVRLGIRGEVLALDVEHLEGIVP